LSKQASKHSPSVLVLSVFIVFFQMGSGALKWDGAGAVVDLLLFW